MVSELVYFGSATPRGSVSAEQWSAFVDAVITPRFPAGLTVWTGTGQWRSKDGAIVTEASRILNVVHPSDAGAGQALHEIATAYESQFEQEAVLRVTSTACVAID